jgi:uncharacterized membrane protein YgcG
MQTIISRAARLAAVLALAAGLAATAVACAQPAVAYPTPQVWTVTYQGAAYCGYMYDPHEIDMYGVPLTCTRMMFPNAAATIVAGTVQAALLTYLETYNGFYHSGYWYDEYYQPIGARYHVTIVNRQTFTTSATTFDKRYAPDIKTRSAKASWKGTTKTGDYKFPTSNSNAKKAKPLTGTTGGKTAAGTSNSHDERPPTKTRTGSTGKTGSSGGKSSTGKTGSGGGGRRR